MFHRTFATCLRGFCVTFLLCPKSMYLSLSISNQQAYYHMNRWPEYIQVTRKSIMQNYLDHRRTNDNLDIPKEKTNEPVTEPGFDFTDDEIKKLKLWDLGVISYYIDVPSFADKVLRDRIRWFLNELSSITSLNFVELPRPPEDNKLRWVFFVNRQGLLGCADHSIKNFTNTGVQRVVLGYDCINNGGGLAAAILAVVGVPAQHNAPNRDDYIEILNENIIPEKTFLFEKLQNDEWLFHDLIYDLTSAGHARFYKNSINGRATFKTKVPYEDADIEDPHSFSYYDILKIKMLYNYITRKNNKESKCSKLFLPGKNKTTFDLIGFLKPRQKPNKYLGIETKTESEEGENQETNIESEIETAVSQEGENQETNVDAENETALSEEGENQEMNVDAESEKTEKKTYV